MGFLPDLIQRVDEEYQAGRAGLDYAYAKGIPVVVMEPLRGGLLVRRIPEDIQSIWNSLPGEKSPAAWCLHHIWDHLGVSLLLSGMNEMVHIEENLKEADLARPNSLSAEVKEKLIQVREIYLSRMKVRCTDCGYCMPCSYGVDIPGNFAYYNDGCIFQDMGHAKELYQDFMPEGKRAEHCVECGKCKEACPQGIDIPERLKDVLVAFEK